MLQRVAAFCTVLQYFISGDITHIKKHLPQYHTARCVRLTPTATGHYFPKRNSPLN